MRYQVRWSNGCWKTFDLQLYAGVCEHGTLAEAEHWVDQANSGKAVPPTH